MATCAAELSSTFAATMSRVAADVLLLVSVLRQIAAKACVVFSAGLLTSVAAFIVLRRLEPVLPVAVASSAAAAAGREESPGPRPLRHRRDDVVAGVVSSTAGDGSSDGRATDDGRTYSADVSVAHRMPFSETHV